MTRFELDWSVTGRQLWPKNGNQSQSDGNYILKTKLYDSIDFTCPISKYIDGYIVDFGNYENCGDGKKLFICRTPNQSSIKTINILQNNPLPGSFEFQNNTRYYVIAVVPNDIYTLEEDLKIYCRDYGIKFVLEVGEPNPMVTPETSLNQTSKITNQIKNENQTLPELHLSNKNASILLLLLAILCLLIILLCFVCYKYLKNREKLRQSRPKSGPKNQDIQIAKVNLRSKMTPEMSNQNHYRSSAYNIESTSLFEYTIKSKNSNKDDCEQEYFEDATLTKHASE